MASPIQPNTTTHRSQVNALTGLRAIAAWWVVLFHYQADWTSLFPASVVLQPALGKGFFAVDLFFILSGFILAYTYFDHYGGDLESYTSFLWNRIARIYPVHLFTLATLLALVAAARLFHTEITTSRYGIGSFICNIFLIQSWGFLDWDTWNQPSWSLSAEWFAYVFVFPISWVVLRRVSRSSCAFILILLSIATYMAWNLTPAASGLARFAVRVTCEFFAGSCLCVLFRLRTLDHTHRLTPLGFALGLAAACFMRNDNQWLTPLMILAFLAVILGLSQRSQIANLLGSKPMIYAGEISYSLYMLHVIMQKIFTPLLPAQRFVHSSPVIRASILAVYGISILGVSILTYELIEKPARKKLRDIRHIQSSHCSHATMGRAQPARQQRWSSGNPYS